MCNVTCHQLRLQTQTRRNQQINHSPFENFSVSYMDKTQHIAVNGLRRRISDDDTPEHATSAHSSAQILGALASRSLQDLNDDRLRWIPRDALFETITTGVVHDFLQSKSGLPAEDRPVFMEIISRVCPPLKKCRCRRPHCTGGRILFAASLSLGKSELIRAFFQPHSAAVCDASLPPRDTNTADHLIEILDRILTSNELERFIHFTWQFRSPVVDSLAAQDPSAVQNGVLELPSNASLPWTCQSNVKNMHEEVTTVRMFRIHRAHREIVSVPYCPIDGYAILIQNTTG